VESSAPERAVLVHSSPATCGDLHKQPQPGKLHDDLLFQQTHWIGFVGKILTGNHGFYHEIWGFPVNFPLNQSNDKQVFWSNDFR